MEVPSTPKVAFYWTGDASAVLITTVKALANRLRKCFHICDEHSAQVDDRLNLINTDVDAVSLSLCFCVSVSL